MLNCGTIAEVNYAFIKGVFCFGVIIDKAFQECINSNNCNSIIVAIVRDSNSIISHFIADTFNEALIIYFVSGFK